ncbi:hypothetical protein KS4_33690 [Poriferisphaera corsica]|uniref:Uncharacterized protein n=1 Tax=Poriferisphaera corsica TaxID=2528020 RepID=A0A517YYJ1_9BACT|nr:hypothetical protein KS4_33690 [Poriferisphaera corsica]
MFNTPRWGDDIAVVTGLYQLVTTAIRCNVDVVGHVS